MIRLALLPFLALSLMAQTPGTMGVNASCTNSSGTVVPCGGVSNPISASLLGANGGNGTAASYPNRVNAGTSLASAVSSCGSTPTVIQITQNISTASVTVPRNCALEADGGIVTPTSGSTVTVNGSVLNPTNTALFSTASGGSFTGLGGKIPVEWFGAIGDATITGSGTDNTSAIQATLNSLSLGGCAFFGPHLYKISTAVSTNGKQSVGLCGSTNGFAYPTTTFNGVSMLVSSSATADIVDLTGWWNTFTNLGVVRSVNPSNGAKGIVLNNASGIVLDNFVSLDSIYDLYAHNAGNAGLGHISNGNVGWGYAAPSSYGNVTAFGIYLDSEDGTAENTIYFNNVGIGNNTSTGPTNAVGFQMQGNALNDVDVDFLNIAGVAIGVNIVYDTTNGAYGIGGQDIHFHNVTADGIGNRGIQVTGLPYAHRGSLTFEDGWFEGGYVGADIENSSGVLLDHIQFADQGQGVYVNGSQHVAISNNLFFNNSTNAIALNNSSLVTVAANVVKAGTAVNESAILKGTSWTASSATGNILAGKAGVGISLDSASAVLCAANVVDTGTVTTVISDASNTCSGAVVGVNGSSAASAPQTATPTASPASGASSSSTLSVTLSDATSGSTIYYTKDGSTPTTSSTQYTGAISVTSTTTIKAIATASGYTNSAVLTATYTISSASNGQLVSDPFSGANNAPLSSNWTQTAGSGVIVQNGAGGAVANGSTSMYAYTGYSNFPANQYAQFVLASGSSGYVGPCVRMDSNGDGYCWFINYAQIYRITGNSVAAYSNGSCPSNLSAGDTLKLSISGTTLTCTDVNTGGSFSWSDSAYSSGNPGLRNNSNNSDTINGPFTAGSN